MFVVLQFPFADLRGFVGPSSGRLTRPRWPLVSPETDYVRSIGLVRQRLRGGDKEWAGEEVYCDAHRAFRFPDRLGTRTVGSPPVTGTILRAMRRFYSDGTTSRLEVGLHVGIHGDPTAITPQNAIRLIQSCVEIPVIARCSAGSDLSAPPAASKPIPLVQAGPVIARHLAQATTKRLNGSAPVTQPWWVLPGAPTLLIENLDSVPRKNSVGGVQPTLLPPHATQLYPADTLGVAIAHDRLRFGSILCSTWYIAGNGTSSDTLRRVRIHLLRLHAERECLKHVLLRVNDGSVDLSQDPQLSNAIQLYLNGALRLIHRPKRDGLSQMPILDAAREALDASLLGQSASFKFMRRQVVAKVKGYIDRANATATTITNIYGDQMNTTIQLGNVTVTGDFNVVTAKKIQNSFNKSNDAAVPDALRQKLQTLVVQVAELTKALPADHREKTAQDLEVLTAEVTSMAPRKRWYELSAEGLIEAAKTVATMAAPVTAAVKAVLALIVV